MRLPRVARIYVGLFGALVVPVDVTVHTLHTFPHPSSTRTTHTHIYAVYAFALRTVYTVTHTLVLPTRALRGSPVTHVRAFTLPRWTTRVHVYARALVPVVDYGLRLRGWTHVPLVTQLRWLRVYAFTLRLRTDTFDATLVNLPDGYDYALRVAVTVCWFWFTAVTVYTHVTRSPRYLRFPHVAVWLDLRFFTHTLRTVTRAVYARFARAHLHTILQVPVPRVTRYVVCYSWTLFTVADTHDPHLDTAFTVPVAFAVTRCGYWLPRLVTFLPATRSRFIPSWLRYGLHVCDLRGCSCTFTVARLRV